MSLPDSANNTQPIVPEAQSQDAKAFNDNAVGDSAYDSNALRWLIERGVRIPNPALVVIGKEVPLERIAKGACLHPFTRIQGSHTQIGEHAILGQDGQVVLDNSQIGANAQVGTMGAVTLTHCAVGQSAVLGCGSAEHSVFLGQETQESPPQCGYGFRVVRSLYEEGAASAQHTYTKAAILFPWVTIGSDLNLCDILIAGGVGAGLGQFTEVGSGTIHFNFTPHGDKATGTRIGNVSEGVFLDQPPCFIGGNGALIGPLEADFGAITGAGGRYRKKLDRGFNLPQPHSSESAGAAANSQAFVAGIYGDVTSVVHAQIRMLADLVALQAWYQHVRFPLAASPEQRVLYQHAHTVVQTCYQERVKQLEGLMERLDLSVSKLTEQMAGDARISKQRAWLKHWATLETQLQQATQQADTPPPVGLVEAIEQTVSNHAGLPYTSMVRQVLAPQRAHAAAWVKQIAQAVVTQAVSGAPAEKSSP